MCVCDWGISKEIVHEYSCHAIIDNLQYSDRYFNSDWQIGRFKRDKDNGHATWQV